VNPRELATNSGFATDTPFRGVLVRFWLPKGNPFILLPFVVPTASDCALVRTSVTPLIRQAACGLFTPSQQMAESAP
jgi:hypothetical protein